MLDVCLLGTGGMMPLPYRALTALMTKYNGSGLLIDCGEGTQVALKKRGLNIHDIDTICFTHYHADHISGLPGLLLSLGNTDRREPLKLIGPKGLVRVVEALRVIAPGLPYEIEYHEIKETEEIFEFNGYKITAFRVNHNIVCYGYVLEILRGGKFNVEKAKALGLPVNLWNPLQKGNTVEFEGKTYLPQMVLGNERKGLKVTYCTDTRPIASIAGYAKDSDLFVCEGLYGEKGKEEKAREHGHMTFYEAAEIGKEAQPKEMWLTHYSPSLNYPEEFQEEAQKIFERLRTAKDGWNRVLIFEEDEHAE